MPRGHPSRRPPVASPGPPDPYGAFAAVDSLGGSAAALLAGFAVALIALVVQSAAELRWPDVTLALFSLAAVLFLQVIQLNARARAYGVTPSQVSEWYPDYDDPERQRVIGWELRHHRACWTYLVKRARRGYNCAILALLLGIALLLVPASSHRFGPWRVVAISVIALGIAVEVVELAGVWLEHRPARWFSRASRVVSWIAPPDPPVPRPRYEPDPDGSR